MTKVSELHHRWAKSPQYTAAYAAIGLLAAPPNETPSMIFEHDCIVLTANLPDAGMEAGDVGTVIYIYNNGFAYEVEFITLAGTTVAVATVPADKLRAVTPKDMNHVRVIA